LFGDLIELVESFGGQRVLLIGDLILDRYIYGDAERISPEAPVAVLRKEAEDERVGGAGSVAVNLRGLNIEVICCGVVGCDAAGERIRDLLESQQIHTQGIISLSDRPTTTKTRFVGLAQHRHRQQLMRVDEEVTQPLSASDSKGLEETMTAAIGEVEAVCLEDYDKGLLSENICQKVITAANQAGKAVLVDPARLNDYSKYSGATILTPNRSEFQLASGCDSDSMETIAEHAGQVIEGYDLGGLLITLDREGSLLVLRGEEAQHIPTRPRSVYDNTGAGDAVLAMLAAAIVSGADWEQAARLTNIAGGLEVEKFGCIPIGRDEVIADLRLSRGSSAGKIRDADELLAELSLCRSRGQTIVFTNGCFDLMHAGHVRFLERCREQGHVLVVALNSDRSVRSLNKGEERPIIPQQYRAEMMAALQCVDYVTIFDDPTPQKLIEKLNPDILVKGQDWSEKGVVGREYVEANGGRVILLPLVEGVSTTMIVERIRSGVKQ
jgi:D-beta-D-heptose 7-phosphate kinase/D-beta-D-heptose 1-phosphate adenosyltransferase